MVIAIVFGALLIWHSFSSDFQEKIGGFAVIVPFLQVAFFPAKKTFLESLFHFARPIPSALPKVSTVNRKPFYTRGNNRIFTTHQPLSQSLSYPLPLTAVVFSDPVFVWALFISKENAREQNHYKTV